MRICSSASIASLSTSRDFCQLHTLPVPAVEASRGPQQQIRPGSLGMEMWLREELFAELLFQIRVIRVPKLLLCFQAITAMSLPGDAIADVDASTGEHLRERAAAPVGAHYCL